MNTKFLIQIYNIDNRLDISIGSVIAGTAVLNPLYSHYVDGDPTLNIQVDITTLLISGQNIVQFSGYNGAYTIPGKEGDANPFHFRYNIISRTTSDTGAITDVEIVPEVNDSGTAGPGTYPMTHTYKLDPDAKLGYSMSEISKLP